MARFEQVKETFWSDSAVGVQAPLTDEMVVDAERILGVCLPSALLELLWVQNGGVVADGWNAFPTTQPTSWSDSHVPFDTLAGIGASRRQHPFVLEMPMPSVAFWLSNRFGSVLGD